MRTADAQCPCAGHNGCLHCLGKLQQQANPMCPLCRRPFAGTQLTVNGELRELVALAHALGCAPLGEDAEGWQAVTSQARAQQLQVMCRPCPVSVS